MLARAIASVMQYPARHCSPTMPQCSVNGALYVLHVRTGYLRWLIPDKGGIATTPRYLGAAIIFGANDRTIYRLERAQGVFLANSIRFPVRATSDSYQGICCTQQWRRLPPPFSAQTRGDRPGREGW